MGGGGGEWPKEAISDVRGSGGLLTEVFPRGLSKIGELLMKNSFSVEQAISYGTVMGVSKQLL